MSMFLRTLKHKLSFGLTKFLVQFMPGASYMTFVGAGSSRQLCKLITDTGARFLSPRIGREVPAL